MSDPIPTDPVPEPVISPATDEVVENAPTESHALAATVDAHEEKGVAQQGHTEPGVKDIGWNEKKEDLPKQLVGGLPNDELWTLVRRFNKQIYHVKRMENRPPGGLDLNVADEDEFSPDKLRSNIERLYMTVGVGIVGFGKHIARLRSWNEASRTSAFAAGYFVSWYLSLLMPAIFTMVITLIVYPPSRSYLFPPAPLALVDAKTGGVQTPAAGVLGSHGSITGAPEKHKGEAVEDEAHNFVSSFGAIVMASGLGKHSDNPVQEENTSVEKDTPDPADAAMAVSDVRRTTGSGDKSAKHDKTRKPIEQAVWEKARPAMHAIGDLSDGWERFGNALSPTPPFPRNKYRLRLAAVLAPALLASLFVNAFIFVKASSFLFGAIFFSDPVAQRLLAYLNTKVPNWKKALEPRNSILKGVPTNAQLTVTLLRIGETTKAPLPPPPRSDEPPPDAPAAIDYTEIPVGEDSEEVRQAINRDTLTTPPESEDEKKHKGSRFVRAIKSTTKAGVSTILGTDRIKASAGSEPAKNRLGVVPKPKVDDPMSGPVEFQARYKGKRGWAYILTTAASPCVAFTYSRRRDGEAVTPAWSIAVPDIAEVKKIGGLGWKSKLIVGWAMESEIKDGLEIVDRNGETKMLTAMRLRDEMFNRLCAVGGQMWESW